MWIPERVWDVYVDFDRSDGWAQSRSGVAWLDMRFLRRKKKSEQEPARCPVCRERVPDNATVCHMCGAQVLPAVRRSLDDLAGHRPNV